MNDRKVVDNFITLEQNQAIHNYLLSENFNWFFSNTVSGEMGEHPFSYYFAHVIYKKYAPRSNNFELVFPILEKLNPKSIVSIKANLYPYSETKIKHGYHTDQNFDVKSFLYFVNDNDGITSFEDTGEEIQSKANRGLFFNSKDRHCSSTPTNAKIRLTINFNYF